MYYKRDWLIFVVICALIFLAAARTALDTDLWWHLRAGEETIKQGFPLMQDHFSFTRMGSEWVNHSWLAQVIFYLVFSAGGFVGVGIAAALVVTASMAVLYFQMAGKPIFRAFLLVLGTLVAAVVWSPRPQIFSLLLFSLTGLILHQYKWKRKDYLWMLPVLFILWSNLHGGYPLGIILIGVTLVGEIINRWSGGGLSPAMSWRELRRLIIFGAGCGLAVVINPNGFKMWLIPFQTVEVNALQNLIQEWASPDFHEFFQQPYLWLLFAVFGAMAFSGRRVDAVDLVGVIVFGAMSLIARRHFGPFALVATPVLSRYLWLCWKQYRKSDQPAPNWDDVPVGRFIPGWQKAINLALVGILFFAGMSKVYLVNHPLFITQTMRDSLPVGAVNWVKEHQPTGNMLNEYNWGGYLSWELREYPIFIDGRTDLYGDCGINEWLLVVGAGEFWREIVDGYKIGFTILEPQQPIIRALTANGWRAAYQDEISVVLVRPENP